MVNGIGTVYLHGLKNGWFRGSVLFPEFEMKHLKKAEGHTGRNVVSIKLKILWGLFDKVTLPAYKYAYLHAHIRAMQIWPYSTHIEDT